MFVRNRPWNGASWVWTGKVHWMVRPFVTECGLTVTDSWRQTEGLGEYARWRVCKHCQTET
jgi:hypothetical protein